MLIAIICLFDTAKASDQVNKAIELRTQYISSNNDLHDELKNENLEIALKKHFPETEKFEKLYQYFGSGFENPYKYFSRVFKSSDKIYIGANKKIKYSLIYNPFFDFAGLFKWELSNNEYRISDLCFKSFSDLVYDVDFDEDVYADRYMKNINELFIVNQSQILSDFAKKFISYKVRVGGDLELCSSEHSFGFLTLNYLLRMQSSMDFVNGIKSDEKLLSVYKSDMSYLSLKSKKSGSNIEKHIDQERIKLITDVENSNFKCLDFHKQNKYMYNYRCTNPKIPYTHIYSTYIYVNGKMESSLSKLFILNSL